MAAFYLVETNSMNPYKENAPSMDLCDKFFFFNYILALKAGLHF